jgi:uroporphyrinogen-III decarboxylase
MLPKERIQAALRFIEPDRPPHFEQTFELSEEAFGLSYPTEAELRASAGSQRERLFERCARIYALTVERYRWDAVIVWRPMMVSQDDPEHPCYAFIPFLKDYLRRWFGHEIPVGAFVWDGFLSIDIIKDYMEFSVQLFEEYDLIERWVERLFKNGCLHAERLMDAGADFLDIASDFAFNSGTFLRPEQFAALVKPYLKDLVARIKARGLWVIMHSDGNLMAILDQILEIGPDFLQSIDPMAGMDIRAVKRLTHGKIGLMGNVQCNLMQDGPDAAIRASCDYCLTHAAPGGGYIFSTSNSVFQGIPLSNYELMVDHFHRRCAGEA